MGAEGGLPQVDPTRVAAATRALAAAQPDAALRSQLHALAALAAQMSVAPPGADERASAEMALTAALAEADEPRAIEAGRRLAAIDRAAVAAVDWSAVSGG